MWTGIQGCLGFRGSGFKVEGFEFQGLRVRVQALSVYSLGSRASWVLRTVGVFSNLEYFGSLAGYVNGL